MSENVDSEDNSTEDKAEKTPALIRRAGEVLNNEWFNLVDGLCKVVNFAYTVHEIASSMFN